MNPSEIRESLARFAQVRNWDQFHSPKNLSMGLAAETAELLEIFQWLTEKQSREIVKDDREMALVREEIADVFIYLVRLADKFSVDIEKAVEEKIELNEKKFPVDLQRATPRYNKR